MAACSYEPDRFNVVAVHVAKILSTIAAAFKPRRAPARVPTSLACCLAVSWRIERVFISPRRRRQIDRPYGGSVPFDRDDPALAGISDQDESPISPPVVWLGLRRAELDCYARYCSFIGRVGCAEDPDFQEHRQCHSLNHSQNHKVSGESRKQLISCDLSSSLANPRMLRLEQIHSHCGPVGCCFTSSVLAFVL